jgi:hypothetical protein
MYLRHGFKDRLVVADRGTLKSPEYLAGLLKTMKASGDHHGIQHARWRDLHPSLQKLQCIGVVRNPWSRTASRYLFAKKVIEVEKKVPETYADVSSFEAFLEERHKWGGKEYYWHRAVRGWFPQVDYFRNFDGGIPHDLLRQEHLDEESMDYFRVQKLPRHRNVTDMGDWRGLYSPKTIRIVADWYKDDIDYWGFDFGTAATKNTLYV